MKLEKLAISDEGFIFDPETGNSFITNEMGSQIIKYLKEGLTIEEITKKISNEYEVDEKEVIKDVLEFIEQLRIYGLFRG